MSCGDACSIELARSEGTFAYVIGPSTRIAPCQPVPGPLDQPRRASSRMRQERHDPPLAKPECSRAGSSRRPVAALDGSAAQGIETFIASVSAAKQRPRGWTQSSAGDSSPGLGPPSIRRRTSQEGNQLPIWSLGPRVFQREPQGRSRCTHASPFSLLTLKDAMPNLPRHVLE